MWMEPCLNSYSSSVAREMQTFLKLSHKSVEAFHVVPFLGRQPIALEKLPEPNQFFCPWCHQHTVHPWTVVRHYAVIISPHRPYELYTVPFCTWKNQYDIPYVDHTTLFRPRFWRQLPCNATLPHAPAFQKSQVLHGKYIRTVHAKLGSHCDKASFAINMWYCLLALPTLRFSFDLYTTVSLVLISLFTIFLLCSSVQRLCQKNCRQWIGRVDLLHLPDTIHEWPWQLRVESWDTSHHYQ